MSATTGIPSGSVWGGKSSSPWTDRLARNRTVTVPQETTEHGPPQWLANLGQFLLAAVFTILSIPLMVIGGMVAAVVAGWALILPAVVAGFIIVMVSFVATVL